MFSLLLIYVTILWVHTHTHKKTYYRLYSANLFKNSAWVFLTPFTDKKYNHSTTGKEMSDT